MTRARGAAALAGSAWNRNPSSVPRAAANDTKRYCGNDIMRVLLVEDDLQIGQSLLRALQDAD
jgi:hypothetical protein